MNKYAQIDPSSLELKGMVLSSVFNLKNTHDMLAIKFNIVCYEDNRQANVFQIFPEKGNILRGQSKKIRIKHKKIQQPDLKKKLSLKISISLNNQYNKQFLLIRIANHLTGWSQIKNIPLEEHHIPVKITPEYTNIKSQIRQSVILSNAFQQDDLSSLQDKQQNGSVFQIQQLGIVSRKGQQIGLKNSRLSHKDRNYKTTKQNKWAPQQYESRRLSHSHIKKNSHPNKMFFGEEPKYSQSNIIQQKPQNSKVRINYVTSPKFSSKNIFKEFEAEEAPLYQMKQQENNGQSFVNTLNNKSYQLAFNNSRSQKSFKTANKQDFTKQNSTYGQQNVSFNKRSMQFIIMAIIAAFFVALGSNLGKLLQDG